MRQNLKEANSERVKRSQSKAKFRTDGQKSHTRLALGDDSAKQEEIQCYTDSVKVDVAVA